MRLIKYIEYRKECNGCMDGQVVSVMVDEMDGWTGGHSNGPIELRIDGMND